jgi:dienelactone hydrolase
MTRHLLILLSTFALAIAADEPIATGDFTWRLLPAAGVDATTPAPLIVNLCTDGPKSRTGHTDHTAWTRFPAAGWSMLIMRTRPKEVTDANFVQAVEDAIDAANRRQPVDASRVIALGFSVHGAQAMRIACMLPKRFSGAICVGHCFSPPPKAASIGRSLRLLLICGDRDDNLPAVQAMAPLWKVAGHAMELRVVPGLDHRYRRDEVDMQIHWLAQVPTTSLPKGGKSAGTAGLAGSATAAAPTEPASTPPATGGIPAWVGTWRFVQDGGTTTFTFDWKSKILTKGYADAEEKSQSNEPFTVRPDGVIVCQKTGMIYRPTVEGGSLLLQCVSPGREQVRMRFTRVAAR